MVSVPIIALIICIVIIMIIIVIIFSKKHKEHFDRIDRNIKNSYKDTGYLIEWNDKNYPYLYKLFNGKIPPDQIMYAMCSGIDNFNDKNIRNEILALSFTLYNEQNKIDISYIHSLDSVKNLTTTANIYQNGTFPLPKILSHRSLPNLGLAVGGGGSRAMVCVWGFYSSLYFNDVLNIDYISYASASSGGVWATNGLFYENKDNINLNKLLFQDNYDPLDLTVDKLTNNLDTTELGYGATTIGFTNVLTSIFRSAYPSRLWIEAIGKNMFDNLNLNITNSVTCYSEDDLPLEILTRKDISITKVRDNFPIPISGYQVVPNINYTDVKVNSQYMDADPVSTGFFVSNKKFINNQSYGSRVSTYAFNSVSSDIPNSNNDIVPIKATISDLWNLTLQAGAASMAPGIVCLSTYIGKPLKVMVPYANFPMKELQNKWLYITDGGGFDNSGILSLLRRGITRIVYINPTSFLVCKDTNLGNLFGIPSNVVFVDPKQTQVFRKEEFDHVCKAISEQRSGRISSNYGDPVILYKTTTIANEYLNIPSMNVEILIIENEKSEYWYNNLPAETKKFIDSLSSKNAGVFPLYNTAKPDTNGWQLIGLSSQQSRSLAYMHAYMTTKYAVPFIKGFSNPDLYQVSF